MARSATAHPLILLLVACSLVLAAGAPAAGSSGTVKDSEGRPVKFARVCHVQDGAEQLCVLTDERGEYELLDSDRDLRVVADDFLPRFVPGQGWHEVELLEYPVLFVRLLDATSDEPIDAGDVLVVYGSAAKEGPFPTNRAGVRVRNLLRPGRVKLLGSSEGYEDSAALDATLKPGEETKAVLRLTKKP